MGCRRMLLGLYMGIAEDQKAAHGTCAMMLSGFVTLALYGMLYRLWPAMKKAPWLLPSSGSRRSAPPV